MTDIIDKANDIADRERTASIRAITSRPKGMAVTHCLECGERIPDARRDAVPGCKLCVRCQEWVERGGGFWP